MGKQLAFASAQTVKAIRGDKGTVLLSHCAPLDQAMQRGLYGAESGKTEYTLGLNAGANCIGYNTKPSSDISFSYGITSYFGIGGGMQISTSISECIKALIG